jgi:hypothetical protein
MEKAMSGHGARFKFLSPGAVGPVSGFRWPLPENGRPGAWIETRGVLEPCRSGAHVCRASDLPYWIAEELWETETDGDHVDGIDCQVFRRARLVREVTAWRDGGALRFAAACVVRAAEEVAAAPDPSDDALGFSGDAAECVRCGFVAAGAFAAAIAVARLHGSNFQTAAFRRERAWQAAELERVILAG